MLEPADPRDALVFYYRLARQHGLNDSHSGNASVRDGDTVWVTPTGCCADTLEANDLIACGMDGSVGESASLDGPMHVKVYQKNPEATAVLHTHNPHTVALTMNGKAFKPIDFEGQYYFPEVPVINAGYAEYVEKSADLISDALASNKAVVYRGHGVYVQGKTLDLAYKWACSLELSARTAWLALQAGTAKEAGQ
ncbi:MAG: class II aldolase/adducin family protein [Gammaproteobacteria bacterium]|nr:class II aldolase/adducin family protein [Gammaproteobacteria bacterium]